MPPRHTYWTILFADKPTAFRSATQEELLPTFNQIKGKHPDAVMRWFARGKLWRSEEEARETFDRTRADRPRGPKPESQNRVPRPEWRDKPDALKPEARDKPRDESRPRGPRPEWKDRGPKPEWRDKRRDDRPRDPNAPRPEWRDKPRFDHPPGSPKPRSGEGGRDKPHGDRPRDPRGPRPEWKDRGPKPPAFARKPAGPGYGEAPPKPGGRGGEWRDKPQGDRPRGPKPEWQNRGPKPPWRDKPRDDRPRDPNAPRPEWRDKPRFDRPPGPPPASPKSRSDEGGRGRDWRPGGEHKDPRDRFKVPRDVKRARFKQSLQRDRTNPRPPRKKKDEE